MNQSKLIITLIIVVGLAGGYLYYSQIIYPGLPPAAPLPISAEDKTFDQLKNISLDSLTTVINNAAYTTLSSFGESPVNPGATGKKDLFAPF